MSDFFIQSNSIKGDFEVQQHDRLKLFEVDYKNWYANEANTTFDGYTYTIKPSNFWQTQYEILRDAAIIGTVSFNWKGQMIITYKDGVHDSEYQLQYKGVWKFRFVLSDKAENQLLVMESSWSKLNYHYSVNVNDENLPGMNVKELLLICGYSANLYMSSLVAIY